jgi:hypothetical protein
MSTSLAEVLAPLAERLLSFAKQDPELIGQLRRVAEVFLEVTHCEPEKVEAPPTPATAVQIVEQVQAAIEQLETVVKEASPPVVEPPAVREPLPELTLGRSLPAEPSRPVYPVSAAAQLDLSLLETRCRLKAEGCRWAAKRRRRMSEGANYYNEIEPRDRDIIARAKELPSCFLWMCHSSGPAPADLSLFEEVAGCFEAVAEGLLLVRQIQEVPEEEVENANFEAALDLLAAGQSALRVAIHKIDGPIDTDQDEVFRWLRATATEQQIFIQNHMRLDNPADPARWPELLNRIEEVAAGVQDTKRKRSQRKRLLGKVRHKTSLIQSDPVRNAGEWDLLINAIVELVGGGMQPSNRELRELLIPVIDLLPERESVPRDFERVLEEIDRYLATVPPTESPAAAKSSPDVTAAAELLAGKSLVLIGGDKRPGAFEAIKSSLGLKDLIWIETRAHESFASFGPYVARPDVVAVLLAIRWSSHSYGEVKNFCDEYGKPLVRLPGGYNPNQVAAQIMLQASGRLRG